MSLGNRFQKPKALIDRFGWRSFDIRTLLPLEWQPQIFAVAQDAAKRILVPHSVTSREGDSGLRIPVLTVNGQVTRHRLPWLYDLYSGMFLDLAQTGSMEQVSIAENDLHSVNLNVQRGTSMRYECHVDSNPIEGLLYVTDHARGSGGELVVANRQDATNIAEVDADCSVIFPVAGHLVFFDARKNPHYVRPLQAGNDIRVVVAMNYYTPSCPESGRPADLDQHLFGQSDTPADHE